ncbi:hypothetical protein LSH36_12g04015 [Paralvinella palmiformis]|uniref:Rad60/SUMO-like domain-containing protein n=1 Tax=Paralvinella palmiformis TaxID=53620 RepID=A0AAD9NGD8_9ANNE|nr:hypothetical protein LSH36_12g04015 [Paralvinella palmiformis]
MAIYKKGAFKSKAIATSKTQSRLTINLCFIPPQLPSSDNMSSSVTDDVYSSCVRTQLTTAKLKELASKIILYDSDNNDEEEVNVFKKKSRGKKTLRSTKRPGKQTRKQQNISDEKESRSNCVVILDDDDNDTVVSSVKQHHLYNVVVSFLSLVFSDLLMSKSLEPTPPPTPPSTVVNMRKKWMKEDVKNAFFTFITFRKLERAQLTYKRDSDDDDDVSIIEVVSPVKDSINHKEISVKVNYHSGVQRFAMKMTDSFANVYKDMANHVHASENQLIMFLNDKKIHSYDTPTSIGLQIADIIDCYVRRPEEVLLEEDDSILEDPDIINLGVQTKTSKSKLKIQIRMVRVLD